MCVCERHKYPSKGCKRDCGVILIYVYVVIPFMVNEFTTLIHIMDTLSGKVVKENHERHGFRVFEISAWG